MKAYKTMGYDADLVQLDEEHGDKLAVTGMMNQIPQTFVSAEDSDDIIG